LGRRRRRIIKVVKKKLPKVFACPSCGEETVRVSVNRGSGHAVVQCVSCGLKEEFDSPPSMQPVDAYCRFTDRFYSQTKTSAPTSEEASATS